MYGLRIFLLCLICTALPWSATASLIADLSCRHQGIAELGEPAQAMSVHGMPEGHEHMGHTHHAAAGGAGACASKCNCAHHGAGSHGLGAIAVAQIGAWAAVARHGPALAARAPRGGLLTDVFRPPNAAAA